MNTGIPLLPKVIAWVAEQSEVILREGEALSQSEMVLARAVGVMRPELVRICEVASLPMPDD